MKTETVEKCPKCERAHVKGPTIEQADGGFTADDIQCRCGLTLRWVVPFFKVSQSGYQLHVKRDSETLYDAWAKLQKESANK